MCDVETVTDKRDVQKQLIGRPAGMKDFDIPTGDSDLDYRCPNCGEIGFFRRRRKRNPKCTNTACRVNHFSPFVDLYVKEGDRR
jgi:hypothetical protein